MLLAAFASDLILLKSDLNEKSSSSRDTLSCFLSLGFNRSENGSWCAVVLMEGLAAFGAGGGGCALFFAAVVDKAEEDEDEAPPAPIVPAPFDVPLPPPVPPPPIPSNKSRSLLAVLFLLCWN